MFFTSRQNLFEFDARAASKDDDVFHFVSYLPIKGRLYELDGLKEGPVDHGLVPDGGHWLDLARPIIEQRMQKYQAGEIHFNLMALVSDKLQRYQREMQALLVNFTYGTHRAMQTCMCYFHAAWPHA